MPPPDDMVDKPAPPAAAGPPVLSYRAPADEPPGPTAGDVIRGGCAVVCLLALLAGGTVVTTVAVTGSGVWDWWDRTVAVAFELLVLIGIFVARQAASDYLTGQKRREREGHGHAGRP